MEGRGLGAGHRWGRRLGAAGGGVGGQGWVRGGCWGWGRGRRGMAQDTGGGGGRLFPIAARPHARREEHVTERVGPRFNEAGIVPGTFVLLVLEP